MKDHLYADQFEEYLSIAFSHPKWPLKNGPEDVFSDDLKYLLSKLWKYKESDRPDTFEDILAFPWL